MSRGVDRHGDRPSQSGVQSLEAVASAQRRSVLQRNLGGKWAMDNRVKEDVTMRRWMKCCACSCEDEDASTNRADAGKIDGSRDTGLVRLRPQARAGAY